MNMFHLDLRDPDAFHFKGMVNGEGSFAGADGSEEENLFDDTQDGGVQEAGAKETEQAEMTEATPGAEAEEHAEEEESAIESGADAAPAEEFAALADDDYADEEDGDEADADEMAGISLRITPAPETRRKPRLAFMGEFSAGKSTLTNMLIGASPLPVKVTATKLPPVWITWGDEAPYCEDFEGNRQPVDLDRLDEVDPQAVQVIRIFLKADILELCDLIDMPGISDPNMPLDLWQPIANQADMVVWCTHATQAWRQTEAAAWATVDPALFERSLLLLTRFDKLLSERDGARVLRRVRYEAEGYFADCFPISLTAALAARDDHERWQASGAEAFMETLVEHLHALAQELGSAEGSGLRRLRKEATDAAVHAAQEAPAELQSEEFADAPRVLPRRVRLSGSSATPRPRPERPAPNEGAEESVRV